jgi:hypothetical protein
MCGVVYRCYLYGTDSEDRYSQTMNTCYICHGHPEAAEDPAEERLLPSPCGKCTATVHRSCFDDLQVYEHSRCRCVVLNTGRSPLQQANDGVVVYTTCSMCHTRFEYASRALIQKIAAKMRSDADTDSDSDNSGEQRRAVAFVRWVHAVLHLLPTDTRNHLLQSAQTGLQSVARLSVDEFAAHLHQAAWCVKAAVYTLSATTVLVSVAAAARSVWW